MHIHLIGGGRMGANMARRWMRGGHQCSVFDHNAAIVNQLRAEGALELTSLQHLARSHTTTTRSASRVIWLMLPVGVVDGVIAELSDVLEPGDTIVDGGNTLFHDDIRRAKMLAKKGIHYVDVGTSGGVWGLERGYCLMIGGDEAVVRRLEPILATLSPSSDETATASTVDVARETAEQGYLYCGSHGAGHFVKMVHNGIEYGIMAAIAEGLNILRHANAGKRERSRDAETTPLRHPEHYQYDFDLAAIAEVWRHGSVIGSWLLDLTAQALHKSPDLSEFTGHVSDSGEGRWTANTAVDIGVPAHVLTAALFERFSSRGNAEFANKMLSAMRREFGGHGEKTTEE